MGEMLRYLLVAAFFVIVEVIAVGKKKKKRPAAKLHEPKRAAPPETPQKQADETARERARVFEQADEADEFDDPCEQEAEPRIHLHHADEQAMEQAGEGEDPCHAGAAPKLSLIHICKNIMLMSYSEEETLIGDNTAPVMLLAFSTVSGQAAEIRRRDRSR